MRKMKEFNFALLGKWCWRMLVDREGMWYRVLAARYGEEARRLEVGGRSVSCWWREIAKIRDGIEREEGWFDERVSRKVGDGLHNFFWYDSWVGDAPLRKRFPRLFDLSFNKLATVEEMFTLGWAVGGEAWRWKRRLWVWEEDMLVECRLLLDGFVLYSDISDRWQWDLDISKGYTVNGAYQILTSHVAHSSDVLGDLV